MSKQTRIPANSELLDPLREINDRQAGNNFDLSGIPESFIKLYKQKRWLSKAGIVTYEGSKKLESLFNCQ